MVPSAVPVKTLLRHDVQLLPVIKTSHESQQYCVNIRCDKAQASWQLEWKNRLALTSPSAVIYVVESKNNRRLIGRIEARGQYVFALQQPGKELNLILYDFIHEKVVDSLYFKL